MFTSLTPEFSGLPLVPEGLAAPETQGGYYQILAQPLVGNMPLLLEKEGRNRILRIR